MSANRSQQTKGLGLFAVAVTAFAIGAWTLPSATGASPLTPGEAAEETPAITIGWAAPSARDRDDVHANIPLNEIQDGQFCQAYAVVHVGSGPYYFEWSGQFDDSYASGGPLGSKQIVSGNISEARGEWLRVDVWTNSSKTTYIDFGEATLQIDESYEYNESCEA